MTDPAPSLPLDDDDQARRNLAIGAIEKSNTVVVDFAKHLVTLSFSATGVVLALQNQWIPADDDGAKARLGLAVCLFVLAALAASIAIAGRRLHVSLSDYQDVDRQLVDLARQRTLWARGAMALIAVGVLLTATTALSS